MASSWDTLFDEESADPRAAPPSWDNLFDEPAKDEGSFGGDLLTSLKAGAYAVPGTFADLYGVITGDTDNAVSKWANEGREGAQKEKSADLLALEKQRADAMASADGPLEEFAAGFWETVKSPTLLANFLAEQVPMLGPVGAAGKAAKVGATALKAGEKAAAKIGTGAAVGTGTAMQTGDVAGDAFRDIVGMPQEVWDKNPEYVTLREQLGDDEAKQQIALQHVRDVMPLIAGASLASQAVPFGRTIEKGLAGTAGENLAKSIPGRIAKGAAGEATQESLEEGSGQFLGNVARQGVDPTQDLMEGVGGAAGLGAIGGGVFGGAIGALDVEQDPFDKLRNVQQSGSVDEALANAQAVASEGFMGPTRTGELEYGNQQYIDSLFASAPGTAQLTPAAEMAGPPTLGDVRQGQINSVFGSAAATITDTGELVGPTLEGAPATQAEANQQEINKAFGEEMPTGVELDRQLRDELRRAEGLPVKSDEQKRLAATQVGTPKNTQLADQLVKTGVVEGQKTEPTRVYGDIIKPKGNHYRSKQAAEHALRGKMQTPNDARREELKGFEPVEQYPNQWILKRKETLNEVQSPIVAAQPGAGSQSGTNATQIPGGAPAAGQNPRAGSEGVAAGAYVGSGQTNDTVSRAEVVQALRNAGMTGFAQQQEAMAGLTQVSPNRYRAADVQEAFNRYDLKAPTGPAVLETGLKPAVQRAFPTGKVETLESGAQRVSLPNGSVVTVLPDQTIEVNLAAAKRGYGKAYKGEHRATGSFTRVAEDGVIWLAKEADQGTVNHEAFHMAFQTVLTNKERSVLVKKYGSEEGAAKAYSEWSTSRKNGIFEKIRAFFRNVRDALFGPSAEGTMERVASGKVFKRSPVPDVDPVGETAYELNEEPEPVEPEPPAPTGKPLNLIRLDLSDDTGRKATIRADKALAAADERIAALEQLKGCLQK